MSGADFVPRRRHACGDRCTASIAPLRSSVETARGVPARAGTAMESLSF